ncbi:MAG: hypothetical protein HY268_32825 [Deltaproteobacteria bacterium]|nr:hypothetical protein [Deltaproteobacteria bacterium]
MRRAIGVYLKTYRDTVVAFHAITLNQRIAQSDCLSMFNDTTAMTQRAFDRMHRRWLEVIRGV